MIPALVVCSALLGGCITITGPKLPEGATYADCVSGIDAMEFKTLPAMIERGSLPPDTWAYQRKCDE